jgi:hypothetical protein
MIQVGDESLAGVPKTKMTEDDKSIAVEFKYNGKKYNVAFGKTSDHGCKITVK